MGGKAIWTCVNKTGGALVRMSARMQLNVAKMRVGSCRWTDGDAVKGQLPLAVSEVVGGVVATVATELGR